MLLGHAYHVLASAVSITLNKHEVSRCKSYHYNSPSNSNDQKGFAKMRASFRWSVEKRSLLVVVVSYMFRPNPPSTNSLKWVVCLLVLLSPCARGTELYPGTMIPARVQKGQETFAQK